eukprot:XP_015583507.1 uncharacterized protein LOC8276106 [Ricinus communis]
MAILGLAGRSTSTLMRATWRATTSTTTTTTTRVFISSSNRSPINPILTLRQSRISPPSLNGSFLRRELSSLLPLHSVVASSRLVSKLPSEASTSAEGRFANYLSPI